MGGITTTPPGGEAPLPPPADFSTAGKLIAEAVKTSGFFERFWAVAYASHKQGRNVAIDEIGAGADAALAQFVKAMTVLQNANNPEFYTLVAAFMSDLLGTEVSADQMRQSFLAGGQNAGMKAVGGAFVKQLAGEFGATLDFDNDPGLKAAQTFLGFLISFSVRVGNLTFLSSLIPFQDYLHLDQIREYGEQMASNLGLGRLARRALGPFIDDLVGKPMQDALRTQLRPTDLAAPEAIRTFNRGLIDQATFAATMAKLGYSDHLIEALRAEYLGHLAPAEIDALERYGDITHDAAISAYVRLGFTPEEALLVQTAHAHQRTDSAVDFYIGVLREQVRGGFFDADTFSRLLELLPLTDEFKDRERKIVGQILEQPRHRLTLGEMRKFYAEGLIDLSDWSDFLISEGYSDLAQKLLTFDLLQTSPVEADKLAAAALVQELKDLATQKKAIRAGLLPPGSPPP